MERFWKFWQEWVYDSASPRAEWKIHPHDVYTSVSRFTAVIFGSIVSLSLHVSRSETLEQVEKLQSLSGFSLYVSVIPVIVAWLFAVILVATSEETSLPRYMVAGAATPVAPLISSVIFQVPA